MLTGKAKRVLLAATLLLLLGQSLAAAATIDFWNTQRKGANGDAAKDHEAWFRAAADVGIEFVRLSPENWQAQGRDFLLGDADHFTGIPAPDLRKFREVLDIAHRHDVKILLTMFSLPGARNR